MGGERMIQQITNMLYVSYTRYSIWYKHRKYKITSGMTLI